MDTPTRLHKLTVLSQLLGRLRTHTLDAQNRVIKAAGEEDLRLMLLNHGGGHPGAGGPVARCETNY